MKIKPEKFKALIKELDSTINYINEIEASYSDKLKGIHPAFKRSARNLIHYRALRTLDIRNLQKGLGDIGLTRLARSQSHVMSSLLKSKSILNSLVNGKIIETEKAGISIKKAKKVLNTHTKDLLGYRSKGRRVRIMVTLPTEAAFNKKFVYNLIKWGMNTARINCAHDNEELWLKMVQNVIKASKQLKKSCKISMDLAGPKIRTGQMEPG